MVGVFLEKCSCEDNVAEALPAYEKTRMPDVKALVKLVQVRHIDTSAL